MASCGAETTQHVIAAQSNDSPTERDRIKHERVHPCVPVSVSCVPFACVPASPIFENDTSKSTTNDAVRDTVKGHRTTRRHGAVPIGSTVLELHSSAGGRGEWQRWDESTCVLSHHLATSQGWL